MAEKVKYPPFAVALAIVLAAVCCGVAALWFLSDFLDWWGRN
jgi:uncharacterized YccA/Bax inhibitor family protein